ncbi:MAG: YbbR-like domain-containing protein [Candidatus Omnitrophota bacterium]
MSWGSILFKNFWAKIISLALAIATWFYVFDLVNDDSFSQKKESTEEILDRYKFVMKEIPVKLEFLNSSPEGYSVKFDAIKVEPEKISVFGPEKIIDGVTELKTDAINLKEYTRSANLRVGVHSDEKGLKIKGNVVKVYLPIVTAAEKKPQDVIPARTP